jgi:hypothetical protein
MGASYIVRRARLKLLGEESLVRMRRIKVGVLKPFEWVASNTFVIIGVESLTA